MQTIEHYLNKKLASVLKAHGANESYVAEVINVVESQMCSLLKLWKDETLRKTVLLLGAEEGLFYDPPSKRDIRCFVVVTLRNSPLERIQSDAYAETGAKRPLTNTEVKNITSDAIRYFNALDFQKLSDESQTYEGENVYEILLNKHPVTCMALKQLATKGAKQIDYPPIPILCPYEPQSICQHEIEKEKLESIQSGAVTYDGFSSEIEPGLRKHLNRLTTSPIKAFLTASFKWVTRNPKVLFDVMEFLLTHGCSFVTPNYYLENGHVEKRINLLRAPHNEAEVLRNFQQISQLSSKHRTVISTYLRK